MKRWFTVPDLWHLEKAITTLAMVVTVLAIFGGYVTIGNRFGWLAGSLFALLALVAAAWIVIRFIPLSEYRKRPR